MQGTEIIMIISLVLAVAILFVAIFFNYRKNNPKQATASTKGRGHNAQRAVGAMRSFARTNQFKLIEPAYIKRGDLVANLDAVVVGYFGVLGVIALGYNGAVYGEPNDEQWLQVGNDQSRNHFGNPITEASAAVRAVRDVLLGEKLRKIPVEVVCVFTDDSAEIAIPRSTANWYRVKDFKALLEKEKYQEDCGLDMEKVENALREAVKNSEEEKK